MVEIILKDPEKFQIRLGTINHDWAGFTLEVRSNTLRVKRGPYVTFSLGWIATVPLDLIPSSTFRLVSRVTVVWPCGGSFSGKRARLGCWFRRPAETNF